MLKHSKQLMALVEMLEWANASDSDGSNRNPQFAAQSGFYGKIHDAIAILLEDQGLDYRRMNPNYGGNGSWYEDLEIACEEQREERRIEAQRRQEHRADPVKTVPVTIEHDGIRGAVRKTFGNAIEATKHYVDMLSQGRKPRVHSASREAIVHVLNAGMAVTR